LDQEIRKQVESHRTKSGDGKSGTVDILDLALNDSEYGTQATTSEIVDQMKTFWLAGNETTAAVLCWVYVYLHQNPFALAALREELDNVFGTENVARQISDNPKLLNRLDYTLAVIRETLRLEPPAQMIRMAAEPYKVTTRSGTSYVIDKDTAILINSYQMARTKSIWGEDAGEFKPERFLNGNIPLAFMPFSKRPRDCIGTNLAYLEVLAAFLC
jgi:cytochrome P450